jgi:hypothetical protein
MKHSLLILLPSIIFAFLTTNVVPASEKDATSVSRDQNLEPIELCTEGAKFPLGKSFLIDFGLDDEKVGSYPLDVQCFIENAATCEHFAGEEGDDEDRREEILRALDKYCKDAKALASSLKAKYTKTPSILKILSVCDEGSETVCSSPDSVDNE